MTGMVYTFAGAYAISVMTDLLVPDRYRHPVKAAAVTVWAANTTQGKIANWTGRRLLAPARVLATNPYFLMGVGVGVSMVAMTNVIHYGQQRLPEHTHGPDQLYGPHRYGVGQPFRQPHIEDDHPWLI